VYILYRWCSDLATRNVVIVTVKACSVPCVSIVCVAQPHQISSAEIHADCCRPCESVDVCSYTLPITRGRCSVIELENASGTNLKLKLCRNWRMQCCVEARATTASLLHLPLQLYTNVVPPTLPGIRTVANKHIDVRTSHVLVTTAAIE
jgi:hypothetical protein